MHSVCYDKVCLYSLTTEKKMSKPILITWKTIIIMFSVTFKHKTCQLIQLYGIKFACKENQNIQCNIFLVGLKVHIQTKSIIYTYK